MHMANIGNLIFAGGPLREIRPLRDLLRLVAQEILRRYPKKSVPERHGKVGKLSGVGKPSRAAGVVFGPSQCPRPPVSGSTSFQRRSSRAVHRSHFQSRPGLALATSR
jgi:hypothetical protein